MQSPLANLSSVLEMVRDSATSYEQTLKNNEAATRAVLIDPVLRALGWDVANPYKVEVEKTERYGKDRISADYALKSSSEVAIVIEAKKLGENLEQFHRQLIDYAFCFRIGRLFLTDGIRWEHFTDLQPYNFAPARTFDLHSDDLGQVAAYLVQELDAALISPDEEQIDLLTEQVEQLRKEVTDLKAIENRIRALESLNRNEEANEEPTTVVSESSDSSDVTMSSYSSEDTWLPLEDRPNVTGKKARKLRLPDGEELNLGKWNEVLLKVCRYALKVYPDLQLRLPLTDKAAGERNLIQEDEFNPKKYCRVITVEEKTFYVNVNYDSEDCLDNALHVLKQIPDHLKTTQAAIVFSERA
jgi:predicted type IV restriction endonuclease